MHNTVTDDDGGNNYYNNNDDDDDNLGSFIQYIKITDFNSSLIHEH